MGQPTQTKLWYQSSTIWFNALALAIWALQYALSSQIVPNEYLELATAVFNILNRFKTSSSITLN